MKDARLSGLVVILAVAAAVLGLARPALAAGPTGVIEVCKNPSADVAGKMFNFTVTAAGQSQSVSVTAHASNVECSNPLTVPAGEATVSEGATVGFGASAISVSGGGQLVSSDLGSQSATVNVTAGDASTQTDVLFTNSVANGTLKICKQAAAGSDVLTSFNPYSFAVAGTGYSGPASLSTNVGQCVLQSVPANLQLRISESLSSAQTSAKITLADIQLATGTTGNADVAGDSATLTIAAGKVAEVTFVNQKPKPAPVGHIEVCKAPGAGVAGQSFTFSVSNTVNAADSTQTVTAGSSNTACSPAIAVTAGNVTVAEQTSVGFVVKNIAAAPAGSLVSSDLASGTATVSVAAGDVSTESIVTFTNEAQAGTVKVCKAAAAGSTLSGWFTFNVSGAGYNGPATVQTTAGNCVLVSGVGANAQLTVAESLSPAQTAAGISLAAINLASGTNGTTTSSSATFTVAGNAVSEVTFTNQQAPARQTGTLTICKIAGSGITIGDIYSFTTSSNGGASSTPISIAAGSAATPGCASAGTFDVGDSVVVSEGTVAGVSVSAIAGTPTFNLAAGTARITIAAGNTNTVTYTNSKPATAATGCTYTKGYYKNHEAVLTADLVAKVNAALGTSLTEQQMVSILAGAPAGNYAIELAAQLITAELNIQSGASSTTNVGAAIATATGYLVFDASGNVTLASGVTNDQASSVNDVLDQYNNGRAVGGPAHCGDTSSSTSETAPSSSTAAAAPVTVTPQAQEVAATTVVQQAAAAPTVKPTAKKQKKHAVKKKVAAVKASKAKKHSGVKGAVKTISKVKHSRKTLPFTK